ncbi:N(2)-fixation sustaining protein CowN [Sulfurovum mangrovi]|uniref:N(2)-fixation sustaining protein CowN n=1 Tax=Sulfurovum mangrovi TaxID=2893889 RepID=UPI001E413D31|nr:N(2)-fixation sustaining protein CowN [Sulfurovum mangrovi]UFH58488.1 N(2)-fixation sustaining protein CowN [Sulfurovum mangrovi]
MENEIRDRYVTFQNIDCYENASMVLDAMKELFTLEPKSKNGFWVNFMEKIPENYKEVYAKDKHRDTLYQVCSNVFYIFDLFEAYDFEKGIELMDQCEYECC